MNLYQQMLHTCENAGIKMLSDDSCCKIMALVYCYGCEEMVFNPFFAEDIKVASSRCKIQGGKVVYRKYSETIKQYVREIQQNKAEWISDFENKYGIKFHEEYMEKNDLRIYKGKFRQANSGKSEI